MQCHGQRQHTGAISAVTSVSLQTATAEGPRVVRTDAANIAAVVITSSTFVDV